MILLINSGVDMDTNRYGSKETGRSQRGRQRLEKGMIGVTISSKSFKSVGIM